MKPNTAKLNRTRGETVRLFDHLNIDYQLYWDTGCFGVDIGQPEYIQYYCTTGAWGFYDSGYPKEHLKETTLKRFYENVLSQYLELPPWEEVRHVVPYKKKETAC